MILDSLWKSTHLSFKLIFSWVNFLQSFKMKIKFPCSALTLLSLIIFTSAHRHYLLSLRLLKKKEREREFWQSLSTVTNYLYGCFCLKSKILVHFSWMLLLSIRWHSLIQMKARISGKSNLTSSNIYHFKWPTLPWHSDTEWGYQLAVRMSLYPNALYLAKKDSKECCVHINKHWRPEA